MKIIYAIIAIILAGSMTFTSCSGGKNSGISGKIITGNDVETSAETMDFQKITILNNYCSAENFLYEAEADGEGVWLRAWTEYQDNDATEEPDYYRECYANEEVRQQIAQMLAGCSAASWDGFSESNPDVMDGSSFRLEIILEDGSTISARGSNASPQNYGSFESFFENLILVEGIVDTHFMGSRFEITLPEEWVGCTTVHYDTYGISFYLVGEESENYMLSIDINDYGYEDYYENTIKAGTLVKTIPDDGTIQENTENAGSAETAANENLEEFYVTVRANDRISTDNMADAGDKAYILDGLEDSAAVITGSIQGINGYTFIPYN